MMAMVCPKDVLAEILKADAGGVGKPAKPDGNQRRMINRLPALAGLGSVG
jgi:hypothetical protein